MVQKVPSVLSCHPALCLTANKIWQDRNFRSEEIPGGGGGCWIGGGNTFSHQPGSWQKPLLTELFHNLSIISTAWGLPATQPPQVLLGKVILNQNSTLFSAPQLQWCPLTLSPENFLLPPCLLDSLEEHSLDSEEFSLLGFINGPSPVSCASDTSETIPAPWSSARVWERKT